MSTPPFKPPMRDGLSASCIVLPAQPHKNSHSQPHSVLDFLITHFHSISATEWHNRVQLKKVFDQHGKPITVNTPYQAHSTVFYYRELEHEVEIPFVEQILFENEHLLVVDKPHFLPVSPVGQYVRQSLLVRLKQRYQNEELSPIHRLDRETAGVILFCKKAASRHAYQQLFQQRQVQKTYHAIAAYSAQLTLPLSYRSKLVKGEPFFRMQQVDGEPNSHTLIDVLSIKDNWALYELKPITGKQHQLRVHLAALGIAIKNDPFYPHFFPKINDDFQQPLQLLAKQICFIDPFQQIEFCFESQRQLKL